MEPDPLGGIEAALDFGHIGRDGLGGPSMIARAIAGAFIFVAAADASQACQMIGFKWAPTMTNTAEMHVAKTDSRCGVNINPNKSAGPIQSLEVVPKPSHGTVDIASRSNFGYSAAKGFVGTDEFGIQINLLNARNQPVTSQVNVKVIVGP